MGRSLNICVTAYPGEVSNPEYAAWTVEHPHDPHFDAPPRYSPEATAHLVVLRDIHAAYNRRDVDSMTDYYNVNYSGEAKFAGSLVRDSREKQVAEYTAAREPVITDYYEVSHHNLSAVLEAERPTQVVVDGTVVAEYRRVEASEGGSHLERLAAENGADLSIGREIVEGFERTLAEEAGVPHLATIYSIVAEPKTCPKCGASARGDSIDEVFGFRKLRGNVVPQSWCRPCRRESARARRAAAAGASA